MSDAVNSPSHYRRGGVELADVIDAFDLGRWETQAAQYLFRARHKNDGADEAQDLKKAIWFLQRSLAELERPATKAFDFETTDVLRRLGGIPIVPFALVAGRLQPSAPDGLRSLVDEALTDLDCRAATERTLPVAIETLASRGADPAWLQMLITAGWIVAGETRLQPKVQNP